MMESLFDNPDAMTLLHRYVVMTELLDDNDPVVATALTNKLSELDSTERVIGNLCRASTIIDPSITAVIDGINTLQVALFEIESAVA